MCLQILEKSAQAFAYLGEICSALADFFSRSANNWLFLHVCSLSLFIVNPAQIACKKEKEVRCGDVRTAQCAGGEKTQ